MTTNAPSRPLRVGDVVTVGRAVLDNAPHAIAVVVEVYDRRGFDARGGQGVTLLFESGSFDGFSPDDLDLWHVVRTGHNPDVARYVWTSASRLSADWAAGRFAAVWQPWR